MSGWLYLCMESPLEKVGLALKNIRGMWVPTCEELDVPPI